MSWRPRLGTHQDAVETGGGAVALRRPSARPGDRYRLRRVRLRRSASTPATPYSTSRARRQTRAPLLADIAGRDGSPLPAPPLPSIKPHVLALRHARRTDRTAIGPGCPDSGEQLPVEARVASAERAITRVYVEVHDLSLPPSCSCLAVFGHPQGHARLRTCCIFGRRLRTGFVPPT